VETYRIERRNRQTGIEKYLLGSKKKDLRRSKKKPFRRDRKKARTRAIRGRTEEGKKKRLEENKTSAFLPRNRGPHSIGSP